MADLNIQRQLLMDQWHAVRENKFIERRNGPKVVCLSKARTTDVCLLMHQL